MKKMRHVLFLMILGSLLVGCAMTPMVNTVMNPEVPVTDHAVLYIPDTIRGVTINGDRVRSGNQGVWVGIGRTEPMIVLPPGEHTIRARYYSASQGANTTTVTTGGYVTLEHDFQAGGRYYFLASTSGDRVTYRIINETNTTPSEGRRRSDAEKRVTRANTRIDRVRHPSRVARSITNAGLFADALSAAPTQFEGKWTYEYTWGIFRYNYTRTYVFTGNHYSFETTRHAVAGMDSTVTEQSKGIFELTDSTITMTPLQEDFENVARPRGEVYGYTMTSDQIILTQRNRTVATLVRQQ